MKTIAFVLLDLGHNAWTVVGEAISTTRGVEVEGLGGGHSGAEGQGEGEEGGNLCIHGNGDLCVIDGANIRGLFPPPQGLHHLEP